MRALVVVSLMVLLSGCSATVVDRLPSDRDEPAAPAAPAAPVEFNVEALVVERWGDCLTALDAGEVSYAPTGDGFFPGVAIAPTPSGAIVFDVGLTGTDTVLTLPTGESVELLATVGC